MEIRALLYTLMFARAFGIFCCLLQFVTRITYLAVRGMHIISSSRIKSEDGVLLYTLMFARAFRIFCCFCLISFHIPRSSSYTYSILSCDIVWHRSLTSCGWFRITYLAYNSFWWGARAFSPFSLGIVLKDAPWPCRGGGGAASPFFQQTDVGKIPAKIID